MSTSRRRTGPKPSFNERDVIDAALTIGINQFTMKQVAQALGIGTSSLYRVVSSQEALVEKCLSHLATQFLVEEEGLSWDDYLFQAVDVLWGLLESYPGLDYTFINVTSVPQIFQPCFSKLSGDLLAGGFVGERERIEFVIDFLFEIVVTTHYQLGPVRRDFEMLKEKAAGSEENLFFVTDESWLERGWLDRKVRFIIAGLKNDLDLEAGIKE